MRSFLGETIPPGGSDTDTLLTAAQIDDLLTRHGTTETGLRAAAAEGWDIKAAIFANLVNSQTGTSSRAMSDLYDKAVKESGRYRALAGLAPSGGRTTLGKIVRPGSTIR